MRAVVGEPAISEPAFEICRARNRVFVSTRMRRSSTSFLITASATTRRPRVRSVLIAECFLSVSMLPESMYFGCAGWVSRIHSQAANVALPVMFWPAASPVV